MWRSCGWYCEEVGGHSFSDLLSIFKLIEKSVAKPLIFIANTTKGKGVSFMEGKAEWHNKIPDEKQQRQGRADLGLSQ